jgi:hypothetical protein
VFEMAALIQSPAKLRGACGSYGFSSQGERPVEIHKQIGAVCDIMYWQNMTKLCCELCEGRIDVHNEQRSGRPILIYVDLQETEGEIRINQHRTKRELHHLIPKVSNTTIHEA